MYRDGTMRLLLAVYRTAADAVPEISVTGDGEFAHRIAVRLAVDGKRVIAGFVNGEAAGDSKMCIVMKDKPRVTLASHISIDGNIPRYLMPAAQRGGGRGNGGGSRWDVPRGLHDSLVFSVPRTFDVIVLCPSRLPEGKDGENNE